LDILPLKKISYHSDPSYRGRPFCDKAQVVEPVTVFPVGFLDCRDRLYISLNITQQLSKSGVIRFLADGSGANDAPEVGIESLNELCL
jgi:hypothetical protein